MKTLHTITVIIQDTFDISIWYIVLSLIFTTLVFLLRVFWPKCIDTCIHYLFHIPFALYKYTWSSYATLFIPMFFSHPSEPGSPHCEDFTIKLRHESSGRVISPTQRPLPTTHNKTRDRQSCPGGIRTRNTSKRADVDPRLRRRSTGIGHRHAASSNFGWSVLNKLPPEPSICPHCGHPCYNTVN
jgi:hypothetical protein